VEGGLADIEVTPEVEDLARELRGAGLKLLDALHLFFRTEGKMTSRRLYFVLALVLVAGCATTASTTPSVTTPAVAMAPQDLVGQWRGTWTDPQYASLGSSLDIVPVASGEIAGTYSIDGNSYLEAGSFPFKSTMKNEGKYIPFPSAIPAETEILNSCCKATS
jgi:hypothetical protein